MVQILLFDVVSPLWWLAMAMVGFKLVAFGDALTRREDAYRAADKKTKPFWLIILGLALGIDLLLGPSVFGPLALVGLVAAIVYMVDVRPALKQVTGGRKGGDSKRNMGPYGPW
ncbi:DUF2516 family protein [Kitasatospora sp. MAP5-34]|uniref:DUF2516 family protein n=1 Tax=Kitasatospora sp. MAP5-34 TaxID=3035102 RepID=UPI0024739E59|nr:DUF2516 family protein [Kitasatospora sp. MAP5-34]MDH6576678.1 formate-dependent nitrite reductase membrane component NrfD [Kitasatospora sp. MAP5-34]